MFFIYRHPTEVPNAMVHDIHCFPKYQMVCCDQVCLAMAHSLDLLASPTVPELLANPNGVS